MNNSLDLLVQDSLLPLQKSGPNSESENLTFAVLHRFRREEVTPTALMLEGPSRLRKWRWAGVKEAFPRVIQKLIFPNLARFRSSYCGHNSRGLRI